MSDDGASPLGDYALDNDDEADESCSQQCSAQALRSSKQERSSSLMGSPAYASKMHTYLSHLAKETLTESGTSECKQEDEILTKRRPSERRSPAGLPTDTETESICRDARSWIKSERFGAGIVDKVGEEDEEAIDRSMFEKFKIDLNGIASMKFVKRKLNDATAHLDAYAQEAVQEAFGKALQEITSAAWKRMQDARASGRQCAIADEVFRRKTAEVEEQKRYYVQMQTKYLKEVTMLRDQLNHGRIEKMKEMGINVQMWNPLEDLDAETHARVIACSEEHLKTHLTTESELREALECRLNTAEEALAHAQNKAQEQEIDIAKLREEVTQQRSKSLQHKALPENSDSKPDVMSEKQILCGACGAQVASPAHLVNDLQNKDDLGTAAKLPVALRAPRRLQSLSDRKSQPLASLVSGSPKMSGFGNEHDELANHQNVQAAEEHESGIHNRLDIPAHECASGRSDIDLQQFADTVCEDSEKPKDGSQIARSPRRIRTVTGDCQPLATPGRSSRIKSTQIQRPATYFLDSGARRSTLPGNLDEKASFTVSGSGVRKSSLQHIPSTRGDSKSQPTKAAQDSAVDVQSQQRDPLISKPSFSKSNDNKGTAFRGSSKSSASTWNNSLEVLGSPRVQSWESGLEVSGSTTRVQTWESGLDVPGSTTSAPTPDPISPMEVPSTPRQERVSQGSIYFSPASSTCSLQSPEDNDVLRLAPPAGRNGSKLSSGRWPRFLRPQKK